MTRNLHETIWRLRTEDGLSHAEIARRLALPRFGPEAVQKWSLRPLQDTYARREPYDAVWEARAAAPGPRVGADPDAADVLDALPAPEGEGGPTGPVAVEGRRVLVVSDLHIPHHDPVALRAALDDGRAFGADAVVLLGDVADFYAASAWDRDPNRRDLAREVALLRQFFQVLRHTFRGAPVYYKLGNHEERFWRYLSDKAPELYNLDVLSFEHVLGLDVLGGFTVADRMRHLQMGGLVGIHGHEFGGLMTNPVNPARGLFTRAWESAICGHFHQISQHTERTAFSQRVISTWSLGCLCNLAPRYRPVNKWQHGHALVELDGPRYHVTPRKIVRGSEIE